MMSTDFYFRNKIPVAILGVTNPLGKQLVNLLLSHPWFEIVALCDNEPFVGQLYHEPSIDSEAIENFTIRPYELTIPCPIVFSSLSGEKAKAVEPMFANAGYYVISTISYPKKFEVPQILPQINFDHLSLLKKQTFEKGFIISIPKSINIEIALFLKPLLKQLKINKIQLIAGLKINKAQLLKILGDIQQNNIVKPNMPFQIFNLKK